MSKINPGLYSSEAQDWMTPPHLITALLDFEDETLFDLDPCCSRRNIPARTHYLEQDVDGLTWSWVTREGRNLVFVNPPYGNVLKLWMEKCWKEFNKGCSVWALIPARTETRYQHDFGLTRAGFTVFLKGRLHFVRNGDSVPHIQQYLQLFEDEWEPPTTEEKEDGAAPFPTMLLYFGADWKEKAWRWQKRPPMEGTLMTALEAQ